MPRLENGPETARLAQSRTSEPLVPGIVAGNPIAISTALPTLPLLLLPRTTTHYLMVRPYFILTFNQHAGGFYKLAAAPVRHPYRTGLYSPSCREGSHSRQLSWLLRSSFVLLEVAYALLGEPEVHQLARAVLEL